jgi:hypothetical protein
MAGSCEHNSEPVASIKVREFLDQLSVLSAFQGGLLHGVSLVSINHMSLCKYQHHRLEADVPP